MSEVELKTVPTFRILDYERAVQFYVDFLGFEVDWEHRFDTTPMSYYLLRQRELKHFIRNLGNEIQHLISRKFQKPAGRLTKLRSKTSLITYLENQPLLDN